MPSDGAPSLRTVTPPADDDRPGALRPGWDFAWVIGLTILTFGWGMVVDDDGARVLGLLALASATLLTTLWMTYARWTTIAVWAVVCAGAMLSAVAAMAADGNVARSLRVLLTAGIAVVAPVAVARALVRQPVVNRQTIGGAVTLYLLVGMFFAFLYAGIDVADHGSFFAEVTDTTFGDFLYFSYVTQTTVGYGDLTASADLGRTLAILQALTGQIYLVTVVAFVVGNLGRARAGSGGRD
jgi:hypothetical protein